MTIQCILFETLRVPLQVGGYIVINTSSLNDNPQLTTQGGNLMRILATLKTIATHRVTYRFLLVVAAATGATSASEHIGELETLLCALLTCLP